MFDKHHANFSGLLEPNYEPEPLFVSNVMHKAFIEINEAGSEASAASETFVTFSVENSFNNLMKLILFLTTAAVRVETPYSADQPPPPPEFRADHPFMFYILDKASETIVFSGRITKLEGRSAPRRWSSYFRMMLSPSLWFQ